MPSFCKWLFYINFLVITGLAIALVSSISSYCPSGENGVFSSMVDAGIRTGFGNLKTSLNRTVLLSEHPEYLINATEFWNDPSWVKAQGEVSKQILSAMSTSPSTLSYALGGCIFFFFFQFLVYQIEICSLCGTFSKDASHREHSHRFPL